MTSGMLTAATIEPKLYLRLLFPQRGMDELRGRRNA